MFRQTSAYVKRYDDQTRLMYFFVKDDDLLENCNTISDKTTTDIKIEFDCKLVDNREFLKTKIKYHVDEVTEVGKVGNSHNCLAVIS